MRDIMEAVKPPRALFLNFPDGHSVGKPFDISLQTAIIRRALEALETITEPGTIIDLPYRWSDNFGWQVRALAHYSCLDPGKSEIWDNEIIDLGDGRVHKRRHYKPVPGYESYPD